jgi:hypothetical protein
MGVEAGVEVAELAAGVTVATEDEEVGAVCWEDGSAGARAGVRAGSRACVVESSPANRSPGELRSSRTSRAGR